MIRIGTTILVLVMLFAPLGAFAAPNIYELQVDGLACPFCAYGIEKKLSAIDGVKRVDIELKKGVVVVTMTESAALTESQAHDAVKDAGFVLRGFSQIEAGER